MTAGGRVHHHQVVVALAHLPDRLAHGEDLPHSGGGGGDELEGPGQGADAGQGGKPQLEAQVLVQGRLRVHRHGEEVGLDLPGLVPGGHGLEEVGHVALGVDLAGQRLLAVLGREQGEGGRDRGLAHATLPGHEEQLALEQVDEHEGVPTP